MKQKVLSPLLNTYEFVENLELYAAIFRHHNGYGRWLAEYQRMEDKGFFKPEALRLYYIEILKGISDLSFIYDDAIYYISSKALFATEAYFNNIYCEIRIITGEVAESDAGEPLQYLSLFDAMEVCTQMNIEAEEHLFVVYDSETNKPIFKYV